MNHPDNLTHEHIERVATRCQQERTAYRQRGDAASPACVELLRAAFAGDQAAWGVVFRTFEPLVRSWIGVQQEIEPDDVVQEALLAFARWAPNHPSLILGDNLGPSLAFLRQCTKTALLMQVRRARRPAHLDMDLVALAAPTNVADDVERRVVLFGQVRQVLTAPEEWLVFEELFVYDLRPQEVLLRHADKFASIGALRTVIQRVVRRLRNDIDLQNL